jgi:hypothetical protein
MNSRLSIQVQARRQEQKEMNDVPSCHTLFDEYHHQTQPSEKNIFGTVKCSQWNDLRSAALSTKDHHE